MFNASMFQDGNDVAEHCDSHVGQVLFGQFTQHVWLDTMLSERHGIITRIRRRYASVEKELEPDWSHTFTSFWHGTSTLRYF